MNWIDIVIVLSVASFVVAAYMAGLIREVVTLVGAVLGIVLAGLFYEDLAKDVLVFIDEEDVALIVAFLVLLGAVYLIAQLIAIMMRQVAALLLLGWLDSLGGAAFGLLKGLIVVEVVLIVLVTYPQLGLKSDIDSSLLGPVFLEASDVVLFILPDEFEREVDAFLA